MCYVGLDSGSEGYAQVTRDVEVACEFGAAFAPIQVESEENYKMQYKPYKADAI